MQRRPASRALRQCGSARLSAVGRRSQSRRHAAGRWLCAERLPPKSRGPRARGRLWACRPRRCLGGARTRTRGRAAVLRRPRARSRLWAGRPGASRECPLSACQVGRGGAATVWLGSAGGGGWVSARARSRGGVSVVCASFSRQRRHCPPPERTPLQRCTPSP